MRIGESAVRAISLIRNLQAQQRLASNPVIVPKRSQFQLVWRCFSPRKDLLTKSLFRRNCSSPGQNCLLSPSGQWVFIVGRGTNVLYAENAI